MATTLTSCDDETEKRVVVKAAQPKNSAAQPMQSDFYIIARAYDADFTLAVYPLSTVPFDVFLAWLDDILEAKRQQDLVLSVILRGYDIWQSIRFLDERGIGLSGYVFTRRQDAEATLEDIKTVKKFKFARCSEGQR